MISGARIEPGRRRICTNSEISGTLSTISMQVADQHARDHAEKDVGPVRHQRWPGVMPWISSARRDHAHDRVGRDAEAQQRHERRLRRRVAGGFRPRHAFDRAVTESLRRCASRRIQHVEAERRQGGAAAGEKAEEKSQPGSAQDRRRAGAPVGAVRQQLDAGAWAGRPAAPRRCRLPP